MRCEISFTWDFMVNGWPLTMQVERFPYYYGTCGGIIQFTPHHGSFIWPLKIITVKSQVKEPDEESCESENAIAPLQRVQNTATRVICRKQRWAYHADLESIALAACQVPYLIQVSKPLRAELQDISHQCWDLGQVSAPPGHGAQSAFFRQDPRPSLDALQLCGTNCQVPSRRLKVSISSNDYWSHFSSIPSRQ